MSKIQTNKIQHTATGAAEFTLPTSDGSTGQVLKSDGSGNLSFVGAGKILQVVQGTSTTEDSFTTASFVASSLSATITPTAASSKILIQSSFLVDTKAGNRQLQLAIFRSINGGTFTNISGGNNNTAIGTYAASTRLIEQANVVQLILY